MKTLLVLGLAISTTFYVVSCTSLQKPEAPALQELIRANTQCIIDSKVVYSHNDVPNWDEPPANFCSAPDEWATPIATAIYPLKYDSSPHLLKSKESWFYVTWGCYSTCDKFFNKYKK